MSKRHRNGSGLYADAVIFIPADTGGGPRWRRIERAVRWLWSRGIYPSPAAMGLRLHGRARRDLNDVETAVRNRMLGELGIGRQRRNTNTTSGPERAG